MRAPMNAITRMVRTLVAAPVLGATVLALAVTTDAEAQGRGGRGGFDMFRGLSGPWMQPEYTRRDLPLFAEQLGLDASQRIIVETLLLDYTAEFEAARAVMDESMDQLTPELTEEQQAERDRLRDERRALFTEMRDVRETLERLESGEVANPSPDLITRLEQRLESMQEQLSQLRDQSSDREERDARMEAAGAMGRWLRGERTKMSREFITEVQMVLNEDQLVLWPGFERYLRRMKTMRLGELSGERVDLLIVMRDAEVDATSIAELAEMVEAYTYDLDQALVARNDHLETAISEMGDAMRDQDLKQAESIASKESRLRVVVRAVNERYAEAITGLLVEMPNDDRQNPVPAARFQEEYRVRSFPRVYRPTSMARAFESAQEIEGLDEELLAGVLALEEAYLLNLTGTNEQIVRITRKEEPNRSVARIQRMARWLDGGRGGRGERGRDREEDPVQEAYRQRQELDYRYWQQLKGLLTPEQIAALPEVREPRERGARASVSERLAEVDYNGDGKISKSEAPGWMQGWFDRVDRNGDGVLDTEEQERMGRDRGGRGGGRGGGQGGRGGGQGGRGGA